MRKHSFQRVSIVISFILASAIICQAQIKGVTEAGDEIILYENGTWKYLEEFRENDSSTIKVNPNEFNRSKSSSFLLKAKKADIGFWIDPKKWSFKKATTNTQGDFELTYIGQSLSGIIISEPIEIPIESYQQIALENGRIEAPDLKLITKEYRIVNGLKVLHLEMEGTQRGVKFTYFAYYFSTPTSTVQFLVGSYATLMKKYTKEVDELLNGIVELKTRTSHDVNLKDSEKLNTDDIIQQSAYSPNNNCKKYFSGNWYYAVNNQRVDVERTFEKTIEYFENRKYFSEYTNKWIDNCNYELIFKKTNKPNYKLEKIGDVINLEILEIDNKEMKYSFIYKGFSGNGEMKRVEKNTKDK